MRTLAIDVRAAILPSPTGKGQWVRGFLHELLTRNLPVTLLSDATIPVEWNLPHVLTVRFPKGMRWHFSAARFLKENRNEYLTFCPTSFIVPFLLNGAAPTVPLVHDLIAFRGEPHDRKAKILEHLTLARALASSSKICTISESTRNDLLSHHPRLDQAKITVLYAGPSQSSPAPNISDERTILTIGTLCPRKNQLLLIRAFAALPKDVRAHTRLVIAGGRGWYDRTIVAAAHDTPGVEWLGYVSDDRYRELLSTCHVFAFPSLYEGFGLPVLDALQRGVPVLTSNRGSLHEVAGEAALYIDPEDASSITAGLLSLLRDDALRTRLREAGPEQASQFSWKRTVDLFLEAIRDVQ